MVYFCKAYQLTMSDSSSLSSYIEQLSRSQSTRSLVIEKRCKESVRKSNFWLIFTPFSNYF